MNVYLIDDDVEKVCFLQDILAALNGGNAAPEKEWRDGFAGAWEIGHVTPKWVRSAGKGLNTVEAEIDKVLCNPDMLLQAVSDKDGVCLVDVNFSKDCHRDSGEKIVRRLIKDKKSEVTKTYDEIMASLGRKANYTLAAVLLALCKHNGTPCIIISSAVQFNLLTRLAKKYIFTQLPFPDYQEPDNNSDLVNHLADRIHALNVSPLNLKDFLAEAERLTHPGIDEEGEANQLLRRFLRLGTAEYIRHFCNPGTTDLDSPNALKAEVKGALKTISGLTEQGKYLGRRLRLNGAWMVALGKYREHFADEDWTKVFNSGDLSCPVKEDNFFQALHPVQKELEVRRQTILLFGRLCEQLFRKREEQTESVLEKVTLKPDSLSFILNFPGVKNNGHSLAEVVALKARYARGEAGLEERQAGHDTSTAVWQFWASCSFSDAPDSEGGLFGKQARMNIFGRSRGKTEVRFE